MTSTARDLGGSKPIRARLRSCRFLLDVRSTALGWKVVDLRRSCSPSSNCWTQQWDRGVRDTRSHANSPFRGNLANKEAVLSLRDRAIKSSLSSLYRHGPLVGSTGISNRSGTSDFASRLSPHRRSLTTHLRAAERFARRYPRSGRVVRDIYTLNRAFRYVHRLERTFPPRERHTPAVFSSSNSGTQGGLAKCHLSTADQLWEQLGIKSTRLSAGEQILRPERSRSFVYQPFLSRRDRGFQSLREWKSVLRSCDIQVRRGETRGICVTDEIYLEV